MLSGDFAALAADAQKMVDCGADWLHMDVMVRHLPPLRAAAAGAAL